MIRSPAGFDGEDRIKRYLDYYQPSYGVMMLSAGQFSPLQLFASGEQGVWYDPSDLSTLFQDSAGTTPVTAVEQPVGLMLDKSKGLVLGSELITNGNFSAGSSSWTLDPAWSVSSGQASKTAGAAANITQSLALTSGKTYLVSYTVSSISGGAVFARLIGGSVVDGVQRSTTGTFTEYIVAPASMTGFAIRGATSTVATIDNISVRELSGNHASQSTSASRPVLKQDANGKYYLFFDGTDDSMATGTINPGSVDKAQVFAGVRKLTDVAYQMLCELGATVTSNNGSFAVLATSGAPTGATGKKAFHAGLRGTALASYDMTTYDAPSTNVMYVGYDIGGAAIGAEIVPRVNGATPTLTAVDAGPAGTGNYGSYPLFIGRRNNATLPFNGNLYSLIVRFGATNLPNATIAQTETWVNGKTGAY